MFKIAEFPAASKSISGQTEAVSLNLAYVVSAVPVVADGNTLGMRVSLVNGDKLMLEARPEEFIALWKRAIGSGA